jgi:hypothetical protein
VAAGAGMRRGARGRFDWTGWIGVRRRPTFDFRCFGGKVPESVGHEGLTLLAQRADRGRSRGGERDSGLGRSWRSGLSAGIRAKMVFCDRG